MPLRSLFPEAVENYVSAVVTRETDLQRRLRKETSAMPGAGMQIDADKEGYDGYYESCLELLRAGGLMAFDNTLWSGRVADPAEQDNDTVALRKLNAKVRDDPRVDACLLTVGDGVLLARKK